MTVPRGALKLGFYFKKLFFLCLTLFPQRQRHASKVLLLFKRLAWSQSLAFLLMLYAPLSASKGCRAAVG